MTDGVFLSSLNLSNLLLQGCTFSILGIGMVWVMVSGGIDLSAGAVLGFLVNFAAVLQTQHNLGDNANHSFYIDYRNSHRLLEWILDRIPKDSCVHCNIGRTVDL